MHNLKELKVWQNARKLTKEIYIVTSKFPQEERFGLISQMRSCAVSITSNIAEGSGRGTDKDFSHFLGMSLGSSCELETQVIISCDLEFVTLEQHDELIEKVLEIQRMLVGLKNRLK